MKYLGDYVKGSIIDFKFSTQTTAGAPVTFNASPAVSVYKANDTTETPAGVTLTVDFDGKPGCHHVRIDTTADPSIYDSGNDFQVVITGGEVDGIGVTGAVLAIFSIENRFDAAETLIVNKGTAQAGAFGDITLASGASSTDDYYNDAVVVTTGGTGAGQARQITDYVGSTRVATVDSNWATTPDNTTTYAIIGRIV